MTIFAAYLAYELQFQVSEGNIGGGLYALGWNVIANVRQLFYLLVVNVNSPPVMNHLSKVLSPALAQSIPRVLDLLSWSVVVIGAVLCLKGNRSIRFFTLWMLVVFTPFLGFRGAPRPTRYLYLPSVGFSALVGMLFLCLRDRVKNQRVGAILLLALVAGFLLYNLVPTRIWERQMTVNSQEERALLSQTGDILASLDSVPDRVVVVGLPEKHRYLVWAMNLFYGSETEFAWGEESSLQSYRRGELYLLYRDGSTWAVLPDSEKP
jgi:hypothetical protein